MKKILNVLLVDDHQSIIQAYSNYLNQFEGTYGDYRLNVKTAMCCDSAIAIIENSRSIDVAFVDMRLPRSKNGKFKSGEDLGVLLKKTFPKIKIVIITGHYETLILSSILQNVNPEAMLLKGDIDGKTILEALSKIFNGIPYYSISVLNLLRKKISSSINLDPLDKLMLYELWKGTKTKDLVKVLPLSMGAIEKRKRNVRVKFGAKSKDDDMLISMVLKEGFL
jgi:DNA-binding NarL/FixJ family response regulator